MCRRHLTLQSLPASPTLSRPQRAGGRKNELMALRKLLLAAESHRERGRRVPVELLNNIAALKHRAGDLDGALSVYTEALKEAATLKGQRNAPVEDSKIAASAPPAQRFCMKHGLPRSLLCAATSATITFNIAALHDDKGDAATASSFLNELLRGYPTHSDALARMGRIQERRYHVRSRLPPGRITGPGPERAPCDHSAHAPSPFFLPTPARSRHAQRSCTKRRLPLRRRRGARRAARR